MANFATDRGSKRMVGNDRTENARHDDRRALKPRCEKHRQKLRFVAEFADGDGGERHKKSFHHAVYNAVVGFEWQQRRPPARREPA